jgi:UDP-2,3-diacylglucosamine pyrophosphatase LpxH
VQKLLRKVRKGTKTYFLPGNHDEFARDYLGINVGGVEIINETIHETADGRKLLVLHGDQFDGVMKYAKWLAYLGDTAYEMALRVNIVVSSCRRKLGLPYWSLSNYLKHSVKNAVNFISDFETALATEARARGADGIVCGHIHHAQMRMIDGVLYCNDGDWVETCSALVEDFDGKLEIIHWRPDMLKTQSLENPITDAPAI